MTILPGRGTTEVPLGADTSDVLQTLGSPASRQIISDPVMNADVEVLHFGSRGISVFLDRTRKQVISLEISDPDAELFGKKIFTLGENETSDLMKAHGYALSDSDRESWGELRYSFDEAGIDFYFANKKLALVDIHEPG